ncbi:MAG: N-acetyl-gamma-glutamyl-phosphate reductase [Elusimicrobiota bacterium]
MKVRVGIVGVSGYTGEELLRVLSKHPGVVITYLGTRNESLKSNLHAVYPDIDLPSDVTVETFDAATAAKKVDVIFLALPHAVAFEVVPGLIKNNVKVIDLSADYRLDDPVIYEKWYGHKHTALELLKQKVYGLPELYREKIRVAKLIANPGCYPTSVLLGAAAVLKNKVVRTDGIVVDSKSGISGGGRKFVAEYNAMNTAVTRAYQVGGVHRHLPEIEQELCHLSNLAAGKVKVTFTPHIVPQLRGMVSVLYFDLAKELTTENVLGVLAEFYENEPFIKIATPPIVPDTKDVVNTNNCAITARVDNHTGKLVVVSVIDNLGKGACTQAVQNMNIMFNLEETTGLSSCTVRK